MRTITFLFCACCLLGLCSNAFSQNYNLELRAQVAFPGEPIAGVWGYEQDGRSYALVAGEDSLHIVEVTNPDLPDRIVSLPMAMDWGKELRTFQHYLYVSAEVGPGLVIYDLKNLPSRLPVAYPKKEISQGGGSAIYGHTLHIDTSSATLYVNDGGNFHSWIFKLLPNPFAPVFAGFYQQLGGIHDGYADHDTLYAAHINGGFVAVVDVHDKANPKILQTFDTPGHFTHNTWLTRDRRHLIAADEIAGGYLSVWDIHDLENIQKVAQYQSSPGKGAIPHNAFILGDYAVASWYSDGVILLDLTRPENPVEIGRFDLDLDGGYGVNGSWGNYPYLSSGILLVSDINQGLLVLQPTYTRACYLEATIRDSLTNSSLAGVKMYLLSGAASNPSISSSQGRFLTGQGQPGTYSAVFIKEGYHPVGRTFQLRPGETTDLEINMLPLTVAIKQPAVLLLAAETGRPLVDVEVVLQNGVLQLKGHTDAQGWATVPGLYNGEYDVYTNTWGRLPLRQVTVQPSSVLRFNHGYYDDFYFDHAWKTEGTASSGLWEPIAVPLPKNFYNNIPRTDMPNDLGDKCYVTDSIFLSYIDIPHYVAGGTARLVSPDMDLSGLQQPQLRFNYWVFTFDTSQHPKVFLEDGVQRLQLHFPRTYGSTNWHDSGLIALPEETRQGIWRLVIEATNNFSGMGFYPLEVGIDAMEIREGQVSPPVMTAEPVLHLWPNPFEEQFRVRGLLPAAWNPVTWSLRNVSGQHVAAGNITGEAVDLAITPKAPSGTYFFTLYGTGKRTKTFRLVKI